jgi:hypothetical protein
LCTDGTQIYRLYLFDSGGDGWNGATYELRASSDGSTAGDGASIASGTLSENSESTEWLCLSDGCYELSVGGGTADSEISFEFIDEIGGHFSDLSAPYSDHLCVAGGDVFDHPTTSPTVSTPPSAVPTSTPTLAPTQAPTLTPTEAKPLLPVDIGWPTSVPTPAPTVYPTPIPSSTPTTSASPTSTPSTSTPSTLPTALIIDKDATKTSFVSSPTFIIILALCAGIPVVVSMGFVMSKKQKQQPTHAETQPSEVVIIDHDAIDIIADDDASSQAIKVKRNLELGRWREA